MIALGLEELLREIRARTSDGGERTVAIYGHPLPANSHWSTEELIAAALERQRDVYGSVDLRQDLFEFAADPAVSALGAAVAVFVEERQLTRAGNGWQLVTRTFGEAFTLATAERFYHQPCAGFCTGVLVAPRIIATAAHCIRGISDSQRAERLQQIRIVFGFHMRDTISARTTFTDNDVYQPITIIERSDRNADDWALLRLDRDVVGAMPLRLRRSGQIADGAAVGVLGHPCGIPAKYAGGARVRRNDARGFFRANLDAFGGNSGSPVVSLEGVVEGLLIRGAPDFVRDSAGLNRSLIIPLRDTLDDPPGEDCARATLFAAHVPA
jgi:hypothetical protein